MASIGTRTWPATSAIVVPTILVPMLAFVETVPMARPTNAATIAIWITFRTEQKPPVRPIKTHPTTRMPMSSPTSGAARIVPLPIRTIVPCTLAVHQTMIPPELVPILVDARKQASITAFSFLSREAVKSFPLDDY